jgi:hypothetical protein
VPDDKRHLKKTASVINSQSIPAVFRSKPDSRSNQSPASDETDVSAGTLTQDWPVLAVGTTFITDPRFLAEKITILVRVPAAVATAGSPVWVRMLTRSELSFWSQLSSSTIASSFRESPVGVKSLQPLNGLTKVVDGLGWLTLSRPTRLKNELLAVPEGTLLAVCRPGTVSPTAARGAQRSTEELIQVNVERDV